MLGIKTAIERKYFRIELLFLLFICYIGPIISDLEFSHYEQNDIWKFTTSLEYRIVYGTYLFLFNAVYYWGFIKPFIFKKQTAYVIITIISFVILYHLYNEYVVNWSIPKLSFLSADIRARAHHDFVQTKLFFIISFVLERMVFVIIGFAFLIRSMQQDEEVKELKEQQLLSELAYLKAQLHPHFFFNTMNNIYSLALKQSTNTAPLVAKLSEMMRYILYEADHEKVALKNEVQFLTNYIAAEQIRHPESISINFDVQGLLDDVTIQPLLLLPFIENAFKHGLQDETANGFVNIVLYIADGELVLQVTNSKPKVKSNNQKKGIGLQNVAKRLDLLYPGKYKLDVNDDTTAYEVYLTLQLP